MRHLVTILVAVATLQAHAADVQTISARVVGVHDGDTLTAFTDDKRQLKARVHGSDAPETAQPFGHVSRDRPAALVKARRRRFTGEATYFWVAFQ